MREVALYVKDFRFFLYWAVVLGAAFFLGNAALDYVAEVTDSPWLATLAGLAIGAGLFVAFFGMHRLLFSVVRIYPSVVEFGTEKYGQHLKNIAIRVTLSVAIILFIAAFGYLGTRSAIKSGIAIGGILAMWAAVYSIEKLRLKT